MVVEEAVFLYGPPGKTLFSQPFPLISALADWNSQIPGFFQKAERSGDDRSYAILSAMIVEHHVDRILKIVMPKFDEFAESRDVTFATKLTLLKSLNLIPEHFIVCADAIRQVRNEFAHNFEVETLDNISQKVKDTLISAYNAIPDMKGVKEKVNTRRQMLGATLQTTVFGIRTYESNVRLLFDIIRSEVFLKQLEAAFTERRAKELEAIKAESS